MATELATLASPSAPLATMEQLRLLDNFLSGLSPLTRKGYEQDIGHFAGWLGIHPPVAAIESFLALGRGQAHEVALRWEAAMRERGLSAGTVRRRLAAIRSCVKFAYMLERVAWLLVFRTPKKQPTRDMRGPDASEYRALVATCAGNGLEDRRDLALITLNRNHGFRPSEGLGICLYDLELDTSPATVRIVRKRGMVARVKLAPETVAVIRRLLEAHPHAHEPSAALFPRFDRCAGPDAMRPMTREAMRKMLARRSGKAGIQRPVRPHGLRHNAGTTARDVTGGDAYAMQTFMGHASFDSTRLYLDHATDLAYEVACKVAKST